MVYDLNLVYSLYAVMCINGVWFKPSIFIVCSYMY